MNVLEIRDELIGYWRDNFKMLPTEYPNTPFPDHLREKPYVTFDISFVNGQTVLNGDGSSTRHWGNIFVFIRTPVSSGSRTAYDAAREVLDKMERKRIGSIVTRAGTIDDLSRPREQFGMLVSIPFHTTC